MSEKLVIFVPTDFKPFKRVAHMFEMITVQKVMGKGFNLQTIQAQRVYTIVGIILGPSLNLVRNFKPM